MITLHLVHHLLHLLTYSHHARHVWVSYFRHEYPGMPRGWYRQYAHARIIDSPWQMRAILHHQPSDI